MELADLLNGGIQLVIAILFVLLAVGVIPTDKKLRGFFWVGAVIMLIMAIAKTFGVMR